MNFFTRFICAVGLALATLGVFPQSVSAQNSCANFYEDNGRMWLQNLCNVPISVRWRTFRGSCGGSGCAELQLSVGGNTPTATLRSDGAFSYWVCYYDDYINGSCTLGR